MPGVGGGERIINFNKKIPLSTDSGYRQGNNEELQCSLHKGEGGGSNQKAGFRL